METVKSYGVYFDKWELDVDTEGHLLNPEVLQIVEFECDEETGDLITARRVNERGEVIEEKWSGLECVDDLWCAGPGDEMTIDVALGWMDKWLDDNTEWALSRRQTYWQPAEYVCIGISGCCYDGNEF